MNAITDRVNGIVRKVPTWALYILYLLPVPWLLYLGQTGGLGAEPIKALEHELGEIALQLLIIGLAITLVWLVLDVGILSQIWADILKRPYITIGMAGFVCLVPLAVTSNNWSVRKLGPKWRQLHKLTYLAVILGGVHYIWLVKGFQIEPLVYMAVILGLLALRLPKKRKRQTA